MMNVDPNELVVPKAITAVVIGGLIFPLPLAFWYHHKRPEDFFKSAVFAQYLQTRPPHQWN